MTTTLTSRRLTVAAGWCAGIAGALYVGVQINHPPADLEHITTADFQVREMAKTAMSVLAIAGFTGMLVRNRHRFGVLGIVGYVLVVLGYFGMFATQVIVSTVLPTLSETDPGYVQRFLDAAMGATSGSDLGGVQFLFLVTGMGYAIGGLVFGIALFRAGVLSRWASLLFAYGTVSALALAFLPEAFSRPFAVPVGIALMGLGHSLRHRPADDDATVVVPATAGSPEPVGR